MSCDPRPRPRISTSRPAIDSLRRFAERKPTRLALAHYGLLDDPLAVLDEADGTLRKWADVAESAYRDGRDIAAALAEEFESDLDGVPDEHRHKLEVMNGVHSNAAGLHRWLTTRASERWLPTTRRGPVNPRSVARAGPDGLIPVIPPARRRTRFLALRVHPGLEWQTGGPS